ncbi:MAG: MarR family transcriptional regulator [Candidatus Bathyarchaeota archaeon]|nr:MarR family transcriptional regulator [Candidatus Bathyarchaeota archaeon]
MRLRRLASYCILSALLLLLLPVHLACCQSYVEYKVQIHGDQSADWTITRVSSIDADIDVSGFQQKIIGLVDAAANKTRREMAVDETSLQLSDDISWETQSRRTVYAFKWRNFSVAEDGKLMLGDVFSVAGFFRQLYGEGVLQIRYSPAYVVLSVSPEADERDDEAQMLKWFGTEYFVNAEHSITLISKSESGSGGLWQQYGTIAVVAVVASAAVVAVVYFFRRRKLVGAVSQTAMAAGVPFIESDAEKIVKLIRSSGGRMRQSAITEQCRFSKAKTSQILAALEQKGVVARYKSGRDKIVTLSEQVKGEHK